MESLFSKLMRVFISLSMVVSLMPSLAYATEGIEATDVQSSDNLTNAPPDDESDEQTSEADEGGENTSEETATIVTLDAEDDGISVLSDEGDEYAFSGGNGTINNPYLISSANDMRALSEYTSKYATKGLYFSVTDDIDLGGELFQPIGNASYPFEGRFDGNNHTISGLYINNSKVDYDYQQYTGLFGYVSAENFATAGPTNLIVSGEIETEVLWSQSSVGGVIGYFNAGSNNATLTNLGSRVNISLSEQTYSGGVVGTIYLANSKTVAKRATLNGCFFEGSLYYGSSNASGILGQLAVASNTVYMYSLYFNHCVNRGSQGIGFVKTLPSMAPSSFIFSDCFNSGNVSYIENGAVCTVDNCYWLEGSAKELYKGKTITDFISESYAKSAALVDDLGSDYYVYAYDSYPYLQFEAETVGNPVITLQPQGADLQPSDDTPTLSIEASLPSVGNAAVGTLSYQWYQSNTADLANAEPIEGEVYRNFTPSDLVDGSSTYFWCVVTNTFENAQGTIVSKSTVSDCVTIKVDSELIAATPTILVQPQLEDVALPNDKAVIQLAAEVTGFGAGDLSYQWYRRALGSTDEWTAIVNSNSNFIEPVASEDYEYYCQVTNTCVGTKEPVSINSDVIEVPLTREYYVSSAQDLKKVSELVQSSTSSTPFAGVTVYLQNDIDMTSVCGTGDNAWQPIGSESKPYSGAFNGNGHTISGFYMSSDAKYVGLFGYVSSSIYRRVFSDFTIQGKVVSTGTQSYVGGVFGRIDGPSSGYEIIVVENIKNEVDVSAAGSYTGGIAGYVSNTYIGSCANGGNIVGATNVGGVVGKLTSSSNLYGTYSTGNVTGVDAAVGGLVGDATGAYMISNSYVTSVVSVGTEANDGNIVVGTKGDYVNVKYVYYVAPVVTQSTDFTVSVKDDNAIAITSDQLKSPQFFRVSPLASYFVGVDGEYPRLKWEYSSIDMPTFKTLNYDLDYNIGDKAFLTLEQNLTTDVEADNSVTYQWYSYKKESSIGDTSELFQAVPVEGATAASVDIDTTSKGYLYYFCIVSKNGIYTTSSLSYMKIKGADNAPTPTITTNLTDKNQTIENWYNAQKLTVDATAEGADNIYYTWYETFTLPATVENARRVSSGSNSYTPSDSASAYYFCVVTAAKDLCQDVSVVSDVAYVSVLSAARSQASIAGQPQDMVCGKGQDVAPLSIEVNAPSGTGDCDKVTGITYQWYRGLEATASDQDTVIDGATDVIYNPPTDSAEVYYYYCKATIAYSSGDPLILVSNAAKVNVVEEPVPSINIAVSVNDSSSATVEQGVVYNLNAQTSLTSSGIEDNIAYTWYEQKGDSANPSTDSKIGYSAGLQYSTNSMGSHVYYCVAQYSIDGIVAANVVSETVSVVVNPVYISSEQDLIDFSTSVANGNSYSGRTIKLSNDIILTKPFTPIGNINVTFQGIFDGQGYSVNGLDVDLSTVSSSYAGLFGYAANATIKNVVVRGNVKGCFAAGVVAYATSTTITNCGNEAVVEANGSVAGGIVGYASSSVTVQGCYNTGSVDAGSKNAGGIVGYLDKSGYVAFSYNAGSIKSSYYAGGISGYKYSGSTITRCFSIGEIDASATSYDAICADGATACYFTKGSSVAASFVTDEELVSQDVMSALNGTSSMFVHAGTGLILGWQLGIDANSPVIQVQPQSVQYVQGDRADALSVTTSLPIDGDGASGTLSYQWYIQKGVSLNLNNDEAIEGATNNTLAISTLGVEPSTANYYCLITNSYGENQTSRAISFAATVSIVSVTPAAEPVFVSQPLSASYEIGTTSVASLAVSMQAKGIAGIGDLSYQWYKASSADGEGVAIAGATGTRYTPSVAIAGTEYYYCVVTNTFENVKVASKASIRACVTTYDNAKAAPVISAPLTSCDEYDEGAETKTISINAYLPESTPGCLGELEYQWFYKTSNGVDTAIAGATSDSIKPDSSLIGSTLYYCVVTNRNFAGGSSRSSVTSKSIEIVVIPSHVVETPAVEMLSQSAVYENGDTASALEVSATVSDGGVLTYQWYKTTDNTRNDDGSYVDPGTAIGSATGTTYKPSTTGVSGETYYYCVVTNTYAGVKTSTAASDAVLIKVTSQQIYTAEQLVAFAASVNSGVSTTKPVELMCDIDLSGVDWTPIGTASNTFTGSFNGNGYTIRGLSITESSVQYQGLFGYISSATIQNVNVEGSIKASRTSPYIGGLVGRSSSSTITDCYTNVAITVTTACTGTCYLGGIAGYMSTSSPSRCASAGAIVFEPGTTTAYMGGIAGRCAGTTTTVDECYSLCSISSAGSYGYIGGLFGYSVGITISNCYIAGSATTMTGSTNSLAGAVLGYYKSGTLNFSNIYYDVAKYTKHVGYNTTSYAGITGATYSYLASETFASKFAADGATDFVASSKTPVLSWQTKTPVASPYISSQSDSVVFVYTDAYEPAMLYVNATLTAGSEGDLTYQWYTSDTGLPFDGTLIQDAVESTYTAPIPTDGPQYYYCVVTNTVDGSNAKTTSNAIKVRVAVQPKTPTLNTLPQFFDYRYNAQAESLSVTTDLVTGEDGVGTEKYQWYMSETDAADDSSAQAITGANEATYTPSTLIVGTRYYYCVVTNDCDDSNIATAVTNKVTVNVSSVFNIDSTSDFINFAKCTYAGNTFSGITVKLNCDVDLEDQEWTAIKNFHGVFDGQGHTIKGLNVTSANNSTYAGLFGQIEDATLFNFAVEGKVDVAARYAGGIVAYAQKSHLESLSSSVTVASSYSSTTAYIGGVVGYAYLDKIIACVSKSADNCYGSSNSCTVLQSYGQAGKLEASDVSKANSELHGSYFIASENSTPSLTLSSKAISLALCSVDAIDAQDYSGEAITPNIVVRSYDGSVVPSDSYTVDITNNINSGTANVVIYGINETMGSLTSSFTISGTDINSLAMSTIETQQRHNVLSVEPTPVVTDGEYILQAGKDFTVAYKNNYYATTSAQVVITGTGKYYGTKTVSFTIVDADDFNEESIEISSAKDLLDFAKVTNSSRGCSTNVVLTQDVDLTGLDWTPIALASSGASYSGTFDGQGHVIKGLSSKNGYGLFGKIASNGRVTNLVLEGSIEGSSGYIGAIASVCQGSLINVANKANVTSTASNSAVGGLVGEFSGSLIAGCSNDGAVSGGNVAKIGGLVGLLDSTSKATVINSYNAGTVANDKGESAYVAGLIGYANASSGTYEIRACYNSGRITNANTQQGCTNAIVCGAVKQSASNSIDSSLTEASEGSTVSALDVDVVESVQSYENITIANCYYVSSSVADSVLKIEGVEAITSDALNTEDTLTKLDSSLDGLVESGVDSTSSYVLSDDKLTQAWQAGTLIKQATISVAESVALVKMGEAVEPSVEVKLGDITLKADEDYAVRYESNTETGTAKVVVTGINKYVGQTSATFEITGISIEDAVVSSIPTQVAGTDAITPEPEVALGSKVLTLNKDYKLIYSDNDHAGTATVTIKGIGEYSGQKKVTFLILGTASTKVDSTLTVYTADELYNALKTNIASTVKLGCDIDLATSETTKNWTPINCGFSLVLDGDSYSIHNLNVVSSAANVGMFSTSSYGITIKNLKIDGSVESTNTSTSTYVGALVGGSSISTTYTLFNVESSVRVKGAYYAGGLIGIGNVSFTNCAVTNNATVEVGNSSGYAGGFAGIAKGTMTNCYCAAAITGGTAGGIGGFTGNLSSYTQTITWTNCYFAGTLTGASFQDALAGTWNAYYCTTTNIYVINTAKATLNYVGNIHYVCVDSATLASYASKLGDAFVDSQDSNYLYPILKWTTYKHVSDMDVSVEPVSDDDGYLKSVNVTVKDGDNTLSEGVDYSIAYDSTNCEDAVGVVVTGLGDLQGSVTKYVLNIKRRNIADLTNISPTFYYRDGTYIKPPFKVEGDNQLIEGTDYVVTYTNNRMTTEENPAIATYTGRGVYYGTSVLEYQIVAFDLSKALISFDGDDNPIYAYTGDEITLPNLKLSYISTDGSEVTVKSYQYNVEYENNINTGEATVTISTNDLNFYTGSISTTFKIASVPLATGVEDGVIEITPDSLPAYSYTGSEITPEPTLTYNNKKLVKDTDYTLSYDNNTKVGVATLTITGIGNFAGDNAVITKDFLINQVGVDDELAVSITVPDQDYAYGAELKSPVTITYNGETVSPDEYTVTYPEDVSNAGTVEVVISAKGSTVFDNDSSKTVSYQIKPLDISNNSTLKSVSPNNVVFTGNAVSTDGLTTVVEYNEHELVQGSDYEVVCDDINAGNAALKIEGKGNYTGSFVASDAIAINQATLDISDAVSNTAGNAFVYTGKDIEPDVLFVFNGKTYTFTKDDVAYSNNLMPGQATFTINFDGTGDFSQASKVTGTFDIVKAEQSKPTGTMVVNESVAGKNDGAIYYLSDAMEYKLDGADEYVSVPEDHTYIDGLSAGTYLIRYKATDTHNVSPATQVTVKSKALAYYKLGVDVDSLDLGKAVYGSTFEFGSIDINNVGNMPTQGVVATLSGENADSFVVSIADSIDAASSAALTVVPKAGLAVGTYTATVSVTSLEYPDGISFDVTFEVTPQSIENGTLTASDVEYNASAQTPEATLTLGDKTLTSDDFELVYSDNTYVGTATVTATGKGSYTGEVSGTFTIAKATVTVSAQSQAKAYGAPDAELAYTAVGLQGADELSDVEIIRAAGEKAGSTNKICILGAKVVSGDVDVTANYNVVLNNGTLTIGFDMTDLNTALVTAKAKLSELANITTSEDGTDVATDTDWVSPSVVNALDSAVIKGESVLDNAASATQAEINAAINALNSAVANATTSKGTMVTGWSRVAGSTRYSTMAAISQTAFEISEYAILSRGDISVDSLGASALAGVLDCPILTTPAGATSDLGADAKSELKRLGVKKVYVLGGTNAVSDKAVASVKALGISVERISGNTRIDTANAVAKKAVELAKANGKSVTTCFITRGYSSNNVLPDALAAASYSYVTGAPIFMVDSSGNIAQSTLDMIKSLGFTDIRILGGTAAVSSNTEKTLSSLGSSVKVTRVNGQTRFDTAVQFAKMAIAEGVLSAETVVVARGNSDIDALAATPLVGKNHGVLILAETNQTASLYDFLKSYKGTVKRGYVIGGTGALADSVLTGSASASGLKVVTK